MRTGGKARALTHLTTAGFRVPAFFTCDATSSPEVILAQVEQKLPHVEYFAVRSSADQEDSKEKSFAGHFYSAVGVRKDQIVAEVENVRASYDGREGAVIIQEFIASDLAGVLFTEVAGAAILINSLQGLCVPVVSGESCDEYVCEKDGSLRTETVPEEKICLFFIGGTLKTQTCTGPSLTEKQRHELAALAGKIQKSFGSPQDVEWCFKDDVLYVLQSRPITRAIPLPEEEHYDSANIAESYSGIVLPLTCSFASMVYRQVYEDLLAASGVSRRKLAEHAAICGNLLGFFYGRMYYNMNNWYRMAEFAPGYTRNKKNFERMITSNVTEDMRISMRPSLVYSFLYPFIVLGKIVAFDTVCRRFAKETEAHLRTLRATDFSARTYEECISLFASFNKNLLRRWFITVENDFFVMTYLGLLGKLFSDSELQERIVLPSKATEQVDALAHLSRTLQSVPSIWKAVRADDAAGYEQELMRHPEILAERDSYMETFGGRFANELKLESVGADEDPMKFFSLMRAYSAYTPSLHREPMVLSKPGILASHVLRNFKKHASRREEFRLLRSNTFAMARRLFTQMGILLTRAGVLERADDVFFLTLEEVLNPKAPQNSALRETVAKRKQQYATYEDVTPPTHFTTTAGRPPLMRDQVDASVLGGRPASSGTVRGRVRVFRSFSIPADQDFDIVVTAHTDPGWTALIALSKGLIIEHGGVLSHASIVARELGIPAVIGATGAMDMLSDGQMVEIDGATGRITIL